MLSNVTYLISMKQFMVPNPKTKAQQRTFLAVMATRRQKSTNGLLESVVLSTDGFLFIPTGLILIAIFVPSS